MMKPGKPGRPLQKTQTYLIVGAVIVCFLCAAGTILILLDPGSITAPKATNPSPNATNPSANLTPRIYIPLTQYPTVPPSTKPFTMQVQSVNQSGVSGTVKFEDIAGAVAILLHIDGLPEEEIVPVELRQGSCTAPGELAYQLVSPDAGESETDLSINLKQLLTQKPLAVFVYRAMQDRTVTACGDVP